MSFDPQGGREFQLRAVNSVGASAAVDATAAPPMIIFRGDSDGIVRPGTDVELTVTGMLAAERVTVQGLTLYAMYLQWNVEQQKNDWVKEPVGSQIDASGHQFRGHSQVVPLFSLFFQNNYALEISVPEGTPAGDYLVTANIGGVEVRRTLTVSETHVEVAEGGVRWGLSSPRRKTDADQDADPADGYADDLSTQERRSILTGETTELTLEVLNASGKPAAASEVSVITITTTGGSLSSPAMTAAQGACKPGGSTTCEIDFSALKTSKGVLPSKIRVLLTANRPGAASVSASVTAGGRIHTPEPVAVTLTGALDTLSVSHASDPQPTVLGYDAAAKNQDGSVAADYDVSDANDAPDTGEAARDQITFKVTAADSADNAMPTPDLTVAVRGPDGLPVSSSRYQTKQSGEMMDTLILDIDAPMSEPLAPGGYTLTVSASGGKSAKQMFTVVGGAAELTLELEPMVVSGFGETATATVMVTDAAGEPAAKGTKVTFLLSDSSSSNDAVAVIDTEGAVLTNKEGMASAVLTAVGAGRAVVRAMTAKPDGGSLLKTAVLVVGIDGEMGGGCGDLDALDGLSEPSGFSVWTHDCPTTASVIFTAVSRRGANAIHLWNGSAWIRYSSVDGAMVPGASDFAVGKSDVIYISN